MLILLASFLRLLVAGSIGLGNDEVYYRMYAQYPEWNYFDHPPLVGWLIRATTINLLIDSTIFIRLGAVLSSAGTTWLLFFCGRRLCDDRTGYFAAIIYTATIYGSVIAGTFILPDSPQMLCWSGGLYLLIQITGADVTNSSKNKLVLLFGVINGLGMLCKIHTSFLWLGFLLYILFFDRYWLKQPVLYLSGFVTLLFFYPVIRWNIDNHFVTYLYHSKRVDMAAGGFNLQSMLTFTAGQLFYINPIIFFGVVSAVGAAFQKRLPLQNAHRQLLLLCSLPLIGIAFILSLFNNVLPHWTGPAYTGLILIAAVYFNHRLTASKLSAKLPGILRLALLVTVVITAVGVVAINFYPGTLGSKDRTVLGEGDFTLDMYGWSNIRTEFDQIASEDLKTGLMKPGAVIVSNRWFTAAHIDHSVAMPLKKELVAMGDTSDIHQYAWINSRRKKLVKGDDAYCIVVSENYVDVKEVYASHFNTIEAPVIKQQNRNGRPCRLIYVFRLKGFK